MKDYLLDTNIAGHYAEYKLGIENEHTSAIKTHVEKIDQNRKITYCIITIGEMEYGLKVAPNKNKDDIKRLSDFIYNKQVFDINRHVAKNCYSELRAKLFENFSDKNTRKNLHRMSQWKFPDDLEPLGIQTNDIWIASVAMYYNLILVTNDKMDRIKNVLKDKLEIEDWLKPVLS